MGVIYTATGPLFDGRLQNAVRDGLTDAEQEIADEAYRRVHEDFGRVLRHPTGYLESHVQVHKFGEDFVLDDGGVVYGPWIEGVGSRNRSTRFKGYFTFRRVLQHIRGTATTIAQRAIARRVRGA